MKKPTFLSNSDTYYLVKDAEKLLSPERRRLLRQGLTLGGIMMPPNVSPWRNRRRRSGLSSFSASLTR